MRRWDPEFPPPCREPDHTFLIDALTLSCLPEERCLCGRYTWREKEQALREYFTLEAMWNASVSQPKGD